MPKLVKVERFFETFIDVTQTHGNSLLYIFNFNLILLVALPHILVKSCSKINDVKE